MHRLLKFAPLAAPLAALEAGHGFHSPLCAFNAACLVLVVAWGACRARFGRTL